MNWKDFAKIVAKKLGLDANEIIQEYGDSIAESMEVGNYSDEAEVVDFAINKREKADVCKDVFTFAKEYFLGKEVSDEDLKFINKFVKESTKMNEKRAQEEVVEEDIDWEPWQDEMHAATQVAEGIEESLRDLIDTLRLSLNFADQFVDDNDIELSNSQAYMADETIATLNDFIQQLTNIVDNIPDVIATLEEATGL